MDNCIFCKIIEGKIPSKKVMENDKIIAFEDIQPAAPVHILFVPKKHYKSLNEVPSNELNLMADIFCAIKEIAKEKEIENAGYRVIVNTGVEGGQTVFHLHVHLLAGKKLNAGLG